MKSDLLSESDILGWSDIERTSQHACMATPDWGKLQLFAGGRGYGTEPIRLERFKLTWDEVWQVANMEINT